jgi:protein gp37
LPRIDKLRAAPAAVRFLSIEPLLEDLGTIDLAGIDWVIVGGESGWGARPMDSSWVISIRDQCQANNVPFFFKQWGGAQKSKHGRHLENCTYDELPQRSVRTAPPRSHRMTLIEGLTAEVTA